jgi:lactoylglutathione lyase
MDFEVVDDQRVDHGYVSLVCGGVRIGAASRPPSSALREARQPPTGVELVLEVDDVRAVHQRVVQAGWPLQDDLAVRPWGLTDFRVLDPDDYYLRVTDGPGAA